MARKNVAIIGAGIVGVATAVYLQRDGHRVTMVERGEPGRATSYGNAGSIAPSSIVPMALPGTLKKVPKWTLDPLGPLAMSWRQVPMLLPWLMHFRRACSRAVEGARALRSINGPSLDLYTDLLASLGATELLEKSGMLHVFRSRSGFEGSAFARKLRLDNQSVVELCEGERLREIEPELSPEYTHGFFLPDNAHVRNPLRLVQVLAKHFLDNGGTIIKAEVQDLTVGRDGVTALETTSGTIDVDQLVVAAGAWSTVLAKRLGSRVPVAHERGYHIQIPQPDVLLRVPVTDNDSKFVATPMEEGLRLAGTSEFRSADAAANWGRTKVLVKLGPRMLPRLRVERYSEWMGTRPSTPDSLPILGPSPRYPRVIFAFGHGHFGLMAAPASGQVVSDLIAGRPPRIDIKPFSPSRFG